MDPLGLEDVVQPRYGSGTVAAGHSMRQRRRLFELSEGFDRRAMIALLWPMLQLLELMVLNPIHCSLLQRLTLGFSILILLAALETINRLLLSPNGIGD